VGLRSVGPRTHTGFGPLGAGLSLSFKSETPSLRAGRHKNIGISGAVLTIDSTIPITELITLAHGTPETPLTDAMAAIQPLSQRTSMETT
jgi:hypothetical protein